MAYTKKPTPKAATQRRRAPRPKDVGAGGRAKLAERLRLMRLRVERLEILVEILLSEPGMSHWMDMLELEASTPKPSSTSGAKSDPTHASTEGKTG